MRPALRIAAAIMIAIGAIWVLQGVNILPGSFMTGQMQWAYRGGGCILAGCALLILAARRKRRA